MKIDKKINFALYKGVNVPSLLGFKLINVSKGGTVAPFTDID